MVNGYKHYRDLVLTFFVPVPLAMGLAVLVLTPALVYGADDPLHAATTALATAQQTLAADRQTQTVGPDNESIRQKISADLVALHQAEQNYQAVSLQLQENSLAVPVSLGVNAGTATATEQTQNKKDGCFDITVKRHDRWGCFVTGAIAIPFRAELTGHHDTYPGISGDAFIGLNLQTNVEGFTITPLVYAGYLASLSSTSATTTSTGTGTTTTTNGNTAGALDVGVGIAVPISGANPSSGSVIPHVGLVVGTDLAGSNKFAYNGKLYSALVFGLSF